MSTTYSMLGYAGLLPFIICTVFILMGMPLLSLNPFMLFVSYSAVILSFLAGSLWGRQTHQANGISDDRQLITSNVISVLAWLAIIINQLYVSLLILMYGYVVMYLKDKRQCEQKVIADDYMALRARLTAVALACHLIIIVLGE
ncbi:DUF3429 domain-containing protein [Shewanella algidipiscicola]|uniref:DUF3429 domain-containing protein n=1 Tax=Shewanella algidipiscicola TaxID=614070 RepID=A0ABQ4PIH1_9GAMM|nr:DUF3429 domain-containing protein [Shewanella algidipiscicola]GIU47345.1 hypothetical protein TUM4630_21070 [Shewanella algidipiscicola]